ncbi:MAG: hypothetical protein SGJ11_10525 [Phycisphaerae bacterium]|nr:hypothetical protein [Phycisphaerae bacterium]
MITSAVVSAWVWVHVGVLLVVIAYAACGNAMLPNVTERGRDQLALRPVRTMLLGLMVSAPWVFAAIVLMNLPNGGLKLLGIVLGLAWVLIALAGLSAVALHVGDRGSGGGGAGGTGGGARWTHVTRGAGFVALTWMLPVLGWFVALPLTLACGVGCLLGSTKRANVAAP